MIIFNEESEDIISEKHICYYTVDDGEKIKLMEIVDRKLKHPDARHLAYIFKFDKKIVAEFKRVEFEGSASVLLEAAQNNVRKIEKEKL